MKLLLKDIVGPCPDHEWRSEWKNLDVAIERTSGSVDRKIERGWAAEDARAYCALAAGCTAPIAKSLAEKSPQFAASIHLLVELLNRQACKQAGQAADCYANLEGSFGLVTEDPAWRGLLESERPGTSFQTKSLTLAHASHKEFTAEGMLVDDEVQPSDVVCFVSAPEDAAGLHTMVRTSAAAEFALPPLATVTLQDVEEPGEWKVGDLSVNRRLFIVTECYGPKC